MKKESESESVFFFFSVCLFVVVFRPPSDSIPSTLTLSSIAVSLCRCLRLSGFKSCRLPSAFILIRVLIHSLILSCLQSLSLTLTVAFSLSVSIAIATPRPSVRPFVLSLCRSLFFFFFVSPSFSCFLHTVFVLLLCKLTA